MWTAGDADRTAGWLIAPESPPGSHRDFFFLSCSHAAVTTSGRREDSRLGEPLLGACGEAPVDASPMAHPVRAGTCRDPAGRGQGAQGWPTTSHHNSNLPSRWGSRSWERDSECWRSGGRAVRPTGRFAHFAHVQAGSRPHHASGREVRDLLMGRDFTETGRRGLSLEYVLPTAPSARGRSPFEPCRRRVGERRGRWQRADR